jgi:hypothetical protein
MASHDRTRKQEAQDLREFQPTKNGRMPNLPVHPENVARFNLLLGATMTMKGHDHCLETMEMDDATHKTQVEEAAYANAGDAATKEARKLKRAEQHRTEACLVAMLPAMGVHHPSITDIDEDVKFGTRAMLALHEAQGCRKSSKVEELHSEMDAFACDDADGMAAPAMMGAQRAVLWVTQ